ncbi:unnamed protein product [Parnassius apollo]|uniref:(apollo) hypothetical protein n=1 Tax=Parnassius apollo TaxID=110799 RepID=A0A8S3XZH4_PARAO|nr:unnamed protein product [Parnassius apollo]
MYHRQIRKGNGQKSIYDEPALNTADPSSSIKRQEPLDNSLEDIPNEGLVNIHKKRRLNENKFGESSETAQTHTLSSTPEKKYETPQPETPQSVRVPTIYYGARTHKQLQQVVKEFARTDYCGEMLMTILSSRDYSCIREFDRQTWSSKNDMCRACIKPSDSTRERQSDTNCKFYDNRMALNHKSLPPAFDLDELVAAGEEMGACPYFAARSMASSAHIVFCPYNYLIEPSIRNSVGV